MRRHFASLTALAVVLTSLTGLSAAAAEQAVRSPKDRLGDKAPIQQANVDQVERGERSASKDDGLGVGDELRTYLIRLADEPVASYRGGKQGFVATSTEGRSKLDADAPKSQRYRNHLRAKQAEFVQRSERKLGRDIEVQFTYQLSNNGIAAVMTPAEARKLAADPSVEFIQPDIERELHTDRGPQWIGADVVWNADPDLGLPEDYQGEDMIVGVIDTGINPKNPSFADVGDDGYDHTNPWGSGNYVGVCDSANVAQYDPLFPCNDKLIGAWGFVATAGNKAVDYDGHGSHTASTAVGNQVDTATVVAPTMSEDFAIKGVAPHANLIAYLGCCSLSGLTASIDQAIADGVDVINYSIGSSSPSALWTDFDTIGFLNARNAGIHVATSNGNDGPGFATTGSPSDAPWITSVGATTHDRANINALIDMTGGDSAPPGDMDGKSVTSALAATPIVYAGDFGDALCQATSGHTAHFTGKIVVCDRGVNGRVEKSENAAAQGAAGFVLANDAGNGDSLSGDAFAVPGIHITYDDGVVLKTWLASGTGHEAAIAGTSFPIDPAYGDVMAGFSSRGPNRAVDVIVPDVTAPGVDILAAYGAGNTPDDPIDYDVIEWNFVSGTSMASPHVAGALALIAQARPDWTPAEAQSALMTTATSDVMDSDGSVADPYDIGSGRVRVDNAVMARLTLNETFANYMASNPDEGGDPKTLNLPSFADSQCLQSCSWTRTVEYPSEYAGDGDITWTVAVAKDDEIAGITVTPSEFTLSPGGSQVIEVEADVTGAPNGEHLFGRLTFTPSGVAGTPEVTMPLALVPSTGILPAAITARTARDAGSKQVDNLQAIEITDFHGTVSGLVKGDVHVDELSTDPTEGDPYDNVGDGTTKVYWLSVPEGTERLVAEVIQAEMPDLDLYVGFDADGQMDVDFDEEMAFSASGTALEKVDLTAPEAGDWWVLIQNWEGTGTTEPDAFTLVTAVVPATDLGNAGFDAPPTVPELEPFTGFFHWNLPGSIEGDRYYGVAHLGTSESSPGDIGSIPVTVIRDHDDVVKTASVDAAAPGELVTYEVTVNPNVTDQDLAYTLTDTVPAGMQLVEESVSVDDGIVDVAGDTITWTVEMPTAVGLGGWSQSECPDFGGYYDLLTNEEEPPNAGLVEDTFVAQGFASLAPFPFFGDEYGTLGVTDDGFLVVPGGYGGDPWVVQNIPDVLAPNGLIAGLWSDMWIEYDPGTGVGDERGITALGFGEPGAGVAVVEYDDPEGYDNGEMVGDFQIWVWNYIDPDYPEIEIYFSDMGTLPDAATIGVENLAGDDAFAVLNNADPTAIVDEAVNGDVPGICLDYVQAVLPAVTLSYTAVASGSDFGTVTNEADHITDDPYAQTETASASVQVWEADFTWQPASPIAGMAVTFDGTPSFTHLTGLLGSANDLSYAWDFDGNGTTDSTSAKPTRVFASQGIHAVKLTVTSDSLGTSDSVIEDVGVGANQPPTADAGADRTVSVGTAVTLNGTGSDPNGGVLVYAWNPGDGSGTKAGKTVQHTYTEPGTYTATLTVTDHGGLTGTDSATITVLPAGTTTEDEVRRLSGLGREQTAIALSQAGWATAETVILAYSGDYPDALAAATLGAAVNAPVLQNGTDALADHNRDELTRLGAKKVYVVSGPNKISDAVVAALEAMGITVERLAGDTRFHTAGAIADEIVAINGKADQVVIALGTFWADALSSGTLATTTGAPILLSEKESTPQVTIDAIKRVLATGGKVWMVGGPNTMTADVMSQLMAEGLDVTRLFGLTRYGTNAEVLKEAASQGANLSVAVVASGEKFPDALSAAVAAWKLGGFLILVHPDGLASSSETHQFLVDNADAINSAFVAGGPDTLSDAIITQIGVAIR